MAKDKPRFKTSIKDMIHKQNQPVKQPQMRQPQISFIDAGVQLESDFNDKAIEYNKNIKKYPKEYSKLNPNFRVLVRPYLNTIKEENGILFPEVAEIEVRTKNGMMVNKVQDIFPFSIKAIIVAAPENSKYKEGQEVILMNSAIKKSVRGKGDNIKQHIDNFFVHPDLGNTTDTPSSPADPNYGFILVAEHDIDFS